METPMMNRTTRAQQATPLLAVLLAVGTLTVSPIAAQVSAVPNSLNFQGRLVTPSGNLVPDGTYSVRFSLYDAVSNGTEKWNNRCQRVGQKWYVRRHP